MNILCHTASLYDLFPNYEASLDARIHTCLDADCDGIEISNGVQGILDWQPSRDTITRLQRCIVTIHAELDTKHSVLQLFDKLDSMPFQISNITYHPNELTNDDMLTLYVASKYPCSIENMDNTRSNWRTPQELYDFTTSDWTFDTAHAMEFGLTYGDFAKVLKPCREVHLSLSNAFGKHLPTLGNPNWFPEVPDCNLIVLEGRFASVASLKAEVMYVRGRLGQNYV